MLVALTKNNQLFSLVHPSVDREYLLELRKVQQFFCPACRNPVVLKVGEKLAWHFAHQRNNCCHDQIEGETVYHINGKRLLFNWLDKQGYNVLLEPYIKEAKQRPDLLLRTKNQNYAIEFQCAKLSSEIFVKRTNIYKKHDLTPIWILGGNQLQKINGHYFRLSSFHWLFVNSSFSLLTFCPQSKLFLQLNHLLPLSSTRSYSAPFTASLDRFSFTSIIEQQQTQNFPREMWLRSKTYWRNPRFRLSQPEQFLQKHFFYKGHPLWLFPAEAGFPVDSYQFIETPVYIWQSWIIDVFVKDKKAGEKIHLNLVKRAFLTNVKKGIFQLRQLPLTFSNDQLVAIEKFMHYLCYLDKLERVDSFLFIKKNEIEYPRTFDQALQKDKEIAVKWSDR